MWFINTRILTRYDQIIEPFAWDADAKHAVIYIEPVAGNPKNQHIVCAYDASAGGYRLQVWDDNRLQWYVILYDKVGLCYFIYAEAPALAEAFAVTSLAVMRATLAPTEEGSHV